MARGGWRRQPRDARGRFASYGYAGQTGGRGARLKSAGNKRDGGGKRENLVGADGQAMTSIPKGTIGGNRRTRSMARADMLGSGRGKAFDAAKQAQKDAIRARKAGPKEMSKAEFARRTGGKTRDDSMSAAIEMSRQPHGRTKAGDRRNEARLNSLQQQVRNTDAAYDAAIKSGKIKAPSNSLARKAAGQADNPAVQAAKRLQAKTAAKRRQAKTTANPYVARGDLAVTNIKMSGSRGKALDREITRNVNAQKAASRAATKARNSQLKSDQSRAKKLRNVHGATLAKSYAAKSGQSPREVMNAIKGMAPSKQIKLFQKYVKENRK